MFLGLIYLSLGSKTIFNKGLSNATMSIFPTRRIPFLGLRAHTVCWVLAFITGSSILESKCRPWRIVLLQGPSWWGWHHRHSHHPRLSHFSAWRGRWVHTGRLRRRCHQQTLVASEGNFDGLKAGYLRRSSYECLRWALVTQHNLNWISRFNKHFSWSFACSRYTKAW